MLVALAALLSLAFVGILIWWAFRRKPIKPHILMYLLATLAGIYTLTFFFTMDLPTIVKVLVSILIGAVLIFVAAYLQRGKKPVHKDEPGQS